MNTFKNWFVNNSQKILGKEVLKSNQYGEGLAVEGDISELEKIDVVNNLIPIKGKGLENIITKDVSSEKQEQNLISAHNVVVKKRATNKKKKTKKAIDFAKMRFINPAESPELVKFSDSVQSLNDGLDEGYIKSWVFYKKTKNFPISPLFNDFYDSSESYLLDAIKKGFICYDPEEGFMPSVLYYSGNIYDRLAKMNRSTSDYISNDEKRQQIQKLKSILPKKLLINDDPAFRLHINFKSLFVKKVQITMYNESISLSDAFWEYVSKLSESQLKFQTEGNGYHIKAILKDSEAFKNANWDFRYFTEKDKVKYKQKSTQELNYQMFEFLTKKIEVRDLKNIEKQWNIEHNGYVEPNYKLIPIGFEHNTLFKTAPLEVRTAQKEGVGFMDISGNGIIAYDVGVGKTMTAILAIGNALSNGQCKRPVIVVPNPTYYKWLAEIRGTYDADGNVISEGILPQYKINNFYNLGEDILKEIWNPATGLNEPIEDGSITLLTFTGLEKLGLSPELGEAFKEEVAGIITQKAERTVKEKTADESEAIKMISRGKKGQLVWMDQAGWDYLCIDEAHNMNKIFRSVENNDSKERNKTYTFKQQGAMPVRATKAFFLSRYIQNTNGDRNVCLLTATPFTNSPLEVFSILSLADLSKLKKLGLGSVRTFFDEYIFTTFDKVIGVGNKISTKQVIKGWSNKISLQTVMFSIMNYKSGDDIDELQRPTKYIFPKISELNPETGEVKILPPDKQRKTYLFPSKFQSNNFLELDAWFKMAKMDQSLRVGADLVFLGRGIANTFSPHSYYITKTFSDKEITQKEKSALTKEYVNSLDPIDVIEESLKLKYTMKCIKSIIAHHKKTKTELGCIIIYSNTGKALFGKIRDYLLDEVGYKKEGFKPSKKMFSEVEIISGDTNSNDKENIKEGFNAGKIKVIIGSATIREGIDLQKKTTTVFNLFNEWNPTSYKQLEGRAYRQGNQYANVRIVTPLLIDSSDAMVWQKLEEKTGRINDIFDRKDKTNILDIDTEERETIKWSLMQDIEAVATEMIEVLIEDKKQILKKKEAILKDIKGLNTTKINSDYMFSEIQKKVDRYKNLSPEPIGKSTTLEIYDILSLNKSEIHNKVKNENNESDFWGAFSTSRSDLMDYLSTKQKYDRTFGYVLSTYGESKAQLIDEVIKEVKLEIDYIKNTELIELKSSEFLQKKVLEIKEKRQKLQAGASDFDTTVKIFTDTNYLLDELAKKPKTEIELMEDAVERLYNFSTTTDDPKEKQKILKAIERIENYISTEK